MGKRVELFIGKVWKTARLGADWAEIDAAWQVLFALVEIADRQDRSEMS